MANATAHDSSHYYIPHGSPWPIRGSVALFALMAGAVAFLNDWAGGWLSSRERCCSRTCSSVVRDGHRREPARHLQHAGGPFVPHGMMWFIFSEVMFFAAFFGALFYARVLSVPWLGGQGVKVFTNFILWPDFEGAWPTNGPAHVGGLPDSTFGTIPAIGIPALNTAICSPAESRSRLPTMRCARADGASWRCSWRLTFLLGFTFVGLQAHEYGEATGSWGCGCQPAFTARRSSC